MRPSPTIAISMNRVILFAALVYIAALGAALSAGLQTPAPPAADLRRQSQADVDRKSVGCLTCHTPDATSMHEEPVQAGCTDCHGGASDVRVAANAAKGSDGYQQAKERAHVQPRLNIWPESGANPVRAFAATNEESIDFIRFVNPGICGSPTRRADDATPIRSRAPARA